jgi:hypothetical protein
MASTLLILTVALFGPPPASTAPASPFGPAVQVAARLQSGLEALGFFELWTVVHPAASVGLPGEGRLLLGRPIESDRGLHVLQPENAWSVPEVQWRLAAAAAAVLAVHQTAPDLVVLDVSHPHGGWFWPHRGHQDGTDVDLRLYLKGVKAGDHQRRRVTRRRFDAARTWTLIEWLHTTGAAEVVLLDVGLQRRLYRHARRVLDRSPEAVAEILSYPDARWRDEALVRHVRGHADHMHVRFRAPMAQALGRLWTPADVLMLQRKLAIRRRGPFDHTVQRGDTLSAIASLYGVAVRDITRWNAFSVKQTLRPGQVLRLLPEP